MTVHEQGIRFAIFKINGYMIISILLSHSSKPTISMRSEAQTVDQYLTELPTDRREAFEKKYRATGKRFAVGKSCVRFRKLENLPLSLIGKTIGSMTANDFIDGVKAATSARMSKK